VTCSLPPGDLLFLFPRSLGRGRRWGLLLYRRRRRDPVEGRQARRPALDPVEGAKLATCSLPPGGRAGPCSTACAWTRGSRAGGGRAAAHGIHRICVSGTRSSSGSGSGGPDVRSSPAVTARHLRAGDEGEARRRWFGDGRVRVGRWSWRWWSRRRRSMRAGGAGGRAAEEAETGGARRRLGWGKAQPPPRMRLSGGLAAKYSTCCSTCWS
jgi:hypothetical protein